MNTLTPKRHTSDRGASLVEILVTVFLLAVVGTIIAGTVIAAMKTTRSTASGVEGQSELNDAISRIARDIAAADPVLATNSTWGTGVGTSPSATELWTQSVVRYKCVRTRYWLDTTGATKALKSSTQTFTGETCPDPTTPVSTPTPVIKTIIKDFKTTDTSGATVPLFTYYDKANATIAAPIARVNIAKIARIKVDVGSNVRERANGVRLSTSAALRALDGSLVTGVPAPVCASYKSADNVATIIGADMTGGHDTAYVTAPVITWKTADYGDTYVLRRGNTDTTGVFNGTWATVGTWTSGQNYTDSAMRGRYGRDLKYELDITGPGGSVTCGVDVARIANKPPAAPTLTISLTPDTRNGPHSADFTQSDAQMSWSRSAEAERYQFYNRPIDPDVAPYNATGAGTWTSWNWPFDDPTTTTAAGMFFDTALEWHLVAVDMDWYAPDGTQGVASLPSNTGKTLAHNNAPIISAVVSNSASSTQTGPVTYNENRISWTVPGDSTIDGYRVWKRPTGTSTWAAASGKLAASTRTFLDTGVALDTRYDYTVTAFNDGPRGTGANAGTITYYGRYSNIVTLLQYPSIPTATAHGTENGNAYNPDGRNSIEWTAVPNVANYEIWEYDNQAQAASGYGTWTFYGVGNTTLRYDSNGQNGGAVVPGSRDFYAVIARNATGFSENHNTPNGPALRAAYGSTAYQRPSTPPMTWNTAPSLDPNASVGNATIFNYTRNADDGEGGDKYCSDPALCTYYAYRDSALQETETGNTGDGIIGAMGQAAWWGTTSNWYVYSCNPGGCSNPHTVAPVNYYPGPQWVNANNINRYMRTWKWNRMINGGARTDEFGGADKDGGADYDFGYSQGATTYLAQKREWYDDPLDMGWDKWVSETGAARTAGREWAMPGSAVYYKVTAYAPNGLTRATDTVFNMPPSPTKFMETARFCNTSNTSVWRIGARVVPQTATAVPWDHGMVNTYASWFHITQYVARRNPADGQYGQEFIDRVAQREYDSVNGSVNGTPAVSGGNFPSSFTSNTADYQYWYHYGMNPSGGNAVDFGIMTGGGWNLPRGQSGVGGAIRVNPTISTSATGHETSNGRTDGQPVTLTEYTPDGGMACNGSTWHVELDTISRQATVNSGSAMTPLSGAGRTWGLSGN